MQTATIHNFNKAAAQYNAHARIQRRVAEELAERITPSGVVWDIGCGTGFLAEMLAPKPVYQIDIALNMCKEAQTHGLALVGDMHALPLQKSAADRLVSSAALQWCEDWDALAREWYAALKPKGRAHVALFTQHSLPELKHVADDGLALHSLPTEIEVEDAFNGAGFKTVSQETTLFEETHDNLKTLLKSIKNVGARAHQKGTLTKEKLARWEASFPRDEDSGRLKLSWHVLFLEVEK